MRVSIAVFSFVVVPMLSACRGSSSSVKTMPPPPAPGNYLYKGKIQSDFSITSATTGITYPYHVYLPPNYESSGKSYPVIYGTDAQWIFPSFPQTIDAKNKEVIFVGIEEGPRNSDRRAIDYQPDGAPKYIDFLKKELIPLIEKNYRTSGERTFVGTSYGGLLGSILLSKEPVGVPYFKNYLLFDGSFFRLQPANLQDEEARFNASKRLDVTVVLTSASQGNVLHVNTYQTRYESRPYEGMKLLRYSYNISHEDVAGPSFPACLDQIY